MLAGPFSGRRHHSQIGSLIPNHSNQDRRWRKNLHRTGVLNIRQASESHMLSVVLSEHSFHRRCHTGPVGTEYWHCAAPGGEGRTGALRCLTKQEMGGGV